MVDNNLKFLDCTIYKSQFSQFEFKNFQKASKSNVLINFKKSISPEKYKLSTLSGEIHRMRTTCSTDDDLNHALKLLKSKFIQNEYPVHIINNKIQYIQSKNFETNTDNDYATQTIEHPDRFHTFITQYSSTQLEYISRSLRKAIREVTPLFRINFAYQSPKISTFLLHNLKPKLPDLDKSGVVYKFTCDCKASYVGETTRNLNVRIREHNQKSRSSEIYSHTSQCNQYQESLPTNVTSKQSSFYNHIKERFSILHSNLHNYHARTITESLYINLTKPTLNKQFSSTKLHIF